MEDLSDNEREEQLRRWWSENWLWIVGGIALGLAVLAGYQYWQKTRFAGGGTGRSQRTSRVLDSLSRTSRDAAAKQADDLRSAASEVAVRRPGGPRAGARCRRCARFRRRREAPAHGRGRLARSAAAAGRDARGSHACSASRASTTTRSHCSTSPEAGAFAALFHEIRGDMFAAKGDAAGGAHANTTRCSPASRADARPASIAPYVELKRDALAGAATVAARRGQPRRRPRRRRTGGRNHEARFACALAAACAARCCCSSRRAATRTRTPSRRPS